MEEKRNEQRKGNEGNNIPSALCVWILERERGTKLAYAFFGQNK